MSDTLLPCPFCGAQPEQHFMSGGPVDAWSCPTYGCPAFEESTSSDRWNTRFLVYAGPAVSFTAMSETTTGALRLSAPIPPLPGNLLFGGDHAMTTLPDPLNAARAEKAEESLRMANDSAVRQEDRRIEAESERDQAVKERDEARSEAARVKAERDRLRLGLESVMSELRIILQITPDLDDEDEDGEREEFRSCLKTAKDVAGRALHYAGKKIAAFTAPPTPPTQPTREVQRCLSCGSPAESRGCCRACNALFDNIVEGVAGQLAPGNDQPTREG